jgi:hypothetical protein
LTPGDIVAADAAGDRHGVFPENAHPRIGAAQARQAIL